MKYEHIIFDLDGTLIDTEKAVLKTWQSTLKKYNYEYSLEQLRVVLGITMQKSFEKLNVVVDNQFESQWIQNYYPYAKEIDFFDGAKEMLLYLKEKGSCLGIVTSRSKEEYDKYFNSFNLESIFNYIICADDTKKHKPNPEPLYKYVQLAKTDLKSCIYVGDMLTDIECANRAGIASGLMIWNNFQTLCENADFIFHSPKELIDTLL